MSPTYRAAAEVVATSIAETAKGMAKQYDTSNPTYSPSFTAVMPSSRRNPTAYVVADRHEMVNEFGWTDLAGKHHGGRFVFRRALRRHRKR
ncbi:hypothetical protein [Nonomuraea zeae]|uniref:hypothetical protein n=1 Tax=Nonomuraea zeae TaxID=1642303 RepID=UPI00361349AF